MRRSIGAVVFEGKQEVHPADSTTYELLAKGPGGSAKVSATVMVMAPPQPPTAESKSLLERVESELSDVYFDYDKSDIRDDARADLAKDAEALHSIFADFPDAVIVLEGYCDERGSEEYNLALGDRRAESASDYLEALGMQAGLLHTISYGKERPQCTEPTQECWQKNRRVHFAAQEPSTGSD